MTEQQFWDYLKKLKWEIVEVNDRKIIRWADEPLNCPITAVYAHKTGGTCSANLYYSASRELKLPLDFSMEIAAAADDRKLADKTIRKQLEKVCQV